MKKNRTATVQYFFNVNSHIRLHRILFNYYKKIKKY